MRNEIVHANWEEVRKQALTLLLGDTNEDVKEKVTEETLYSVSTDEATGSNDTQRTLLYALTSDEETGAKVLYFHVPTTKEEYYRIVYFAPKEWGNYTIPFKSLQDDEVYLALILHASFIKPVKRLSPDEALTPDFDNELNASFGENNWTFRDKAEYVDKIKTIEDAFTIMDEEVEENPEEYKEEYKDNLIFTGSAPVYLLSELTGVKIANGKDYLKAVKEYLHVPGLDERQERAVTSSFNFELRDLFLKWCIYEFMRTEDYNHLKECLKEYSKFLLPENWATGLIYLEQEPEEYVISKYLSKDALNHLQRDQLREIANATNTPLSLILKASKMKIWDF